MKKDYYSPRAALSFLCWSIACQTIGFSGGQCFLWFVSKLTNQSSIGNDQLLMAGLLMSHSIAAYFTARFIGLPFGWRLFNLLIAPSIVLFDIFNLPSTILIVAFLFSVLVYLPTFWTRVPFYPTSLATYEKLSGLLPTNGNINFLDLGCGFGKLLFYLSKKHPNIKFEGVEIGPLPYLISRMRSLRRNNMHIKAKSFWSFSLAPYDVVYAFLAPGPMEKLWQKVKSEMRPGSIFISNTFQAPVKANEEISIDDKKSSVLYVYRL